MYKNWLFVFIKIVSDIALVVISFAAGFFIRFGIEDPFMIPVMSYYKILVSLLLTWLVVFNLSGMYKLQTDRSVRIDNVFVVSSAVISAAFFTYIFVLLAYKGAFYSKGLIIYSSLVALFLVNLSRALIWRIYKAV